MTTIAVPPDRRSEILLRLGRVLETHIDLDRTLQGVAAACVPELADVCSVHVIDRSGQLRTAAIASADPEMLPLCLDHVARQPPSMTDAFGVGRAAREGGPAQLHEIDLERTRRLASPETARLVERLGLRHALIVPLPSASGPIGALSLNHAWSGRRYRADDVALAEDLARRAGAFVENARLHDRLARLQDLTRRFSRARTPAEVADLLTAEAPLTAGADTGVVVVRDRDELVVAHADPAPLSLLPATRMPLDVAHPLAQAVREGTDIYVENAADLRARWADLAGAQPVDGAWAILPLHDHDGQAFGGVAFDFARARRFSPADRAFLRALADVGAEALARSRLAADALLRQQLLESQNEAALDGIFFQDNAGRPNFHNRRLLELFGVSADIPNQERFEERLARSLHAVADPGAFAAIARRMEAERDASLRFDLLLKDGRILDAYTTPVLAPGGERLGRAWYYRDVTGERRLKADLVAARQQLAHREKLAAMGTLVSGVAHEIRTPLAYIANHAQVLLHAVRANGTPLPPGFAESAASIEEGVDRINGLVRTLRRFARVEAPMGACALDAAVEAAARLVEATHRDAVRITRELASGATVQADPLQLQQVVINLLENAAEASPPGRTVHVSTRCEDGWAHVVVEDEGAGIAPEVASRMFEPFFTTKPGGTGLGLAIVRRIVETSGGHIDVGRSPRGGARMGVRLPLARIAREA